MSRTRSAVISIVVAALLPLTLLAAACSRPPEQQQLTQFFRAARARDNATLARMSAVEFDPRELGTVEDFEISLVGPEQRRPLGLKALIEAEKTARAAEAEFAKRKLEYQIANQKVLEVVVKLERDPTAKMTPAQQTVKAAWDKWREESTTHTRAVAASRAALSAGIGPADSSLTQPGQPAFDSATFEGDLVTKDVAIAADIRSPQGQTASKNLTVTFARVVGTLAGTPREGRWIITKIDGV